MSLSVPDLCDQFLDDLTVLDPALATARSRMVSPLISPTATPCASFPVAPKVGLPKIGGGGATPAPVSRALPQEAWSLVFPPEA